MRRRPLSVLVLSLIGIPWGALLSFAGAGDIYLIITQLIMPHPLMFVTHVNLFPILLIACYLPLGLLLIVASIASFRLHSWVRRAMLAFAWIDVVTIALIVISEVLRELWTVTMGPPRAPGSAGMLLLNHIPIMISSLVQLAYPICVLIFFTRPRVIAAFSNTLPDGVSAFPVLPPTAERQPSGTGQPKP